VVAELFPGHGVSRDLDDRNEGEALRRAASGRKGDDVAARGREARQDLGLPPGRIHDHEPLDVGRLPVFVHRFDRGRTGLRDGAQRFLLDRRQAPLDVASRRLSSPHVAADRLGPILHPFDEGKDLVADLPAPGMPDQQVLGADELRDLAEDGGPSAADDEIRGDAQGRVRGDPLRRVRTAALESQHDIARRAACPLLDRGLPNHLLCEERAFGDGSPRSADFLDDDGLHILPRCGDRLGDSFDIGALAAEAYQDHRSQVGVAAQAGQNAVDAGDVHRRLAATLVVQKGNGPGNPGGDPLSHFIGANHG